MRRYVPGRSKINHQIWLSREKRIYCSSCKTLLADIKSGDNYYCFRCGERALR